MTPMSAPFQPWHQCQCGFTSFSAPNTLWDEIKKSSSGGTETMWSEGGGDWQPAGELSIKGDKPDLWPHWKCNFPPPALNMCGLRAQRVNSCEDHAVGVGGERKWAIDQHLETNHVVFFSVCDWLFLQPAHSPRLEKHFTRSGVTPAGISLCWLISENFLQLPATTWRLELQLQGRMTWELSSGAKASWSASAGQLPYLKLTEICKTDLSLLFYLMRQPVMSSSATCTWPNQSFWVLTSGSALLIYGMFLLTSIQYLLLDLFFHLHLIHAQAGLPQPPPVHRHPALRRVRHQRRVSLPVLLELLAPSDPTSWQTSPSGPKSPRRPRAPSACWGGTPPKTPGLLWSAKT